MVKTWQKENVQAVAAVRLRWYKCARESAGLTLEEPAEELNKLLCERIKKVAAALSVPFE